MKNTCIVCGKEIKKGAKTCENCRKAYQRLTYRKNSRKTRYCKKCGNPIHEKYIQVCKNCRTQTDDRRLFVTRMLRDKRIKKLREKEVNGDPETLEKLKQERMMMDQKFGIKNTYIPSFCEDLINLYDNIDDKSVFIAECKNKNVLNIIDGLKITIISFDNLLQECLDHHISLTNDDPSVIKNCTKSDPMYQKYKYALKTILNRLKNEGKIKIEDIKTSIIQRI